MSHNYQRLLKKQLEWFLSPKSLGLEKVDGLHAPKEQAQLILESYKQLIAHSKPCRINAQLTSVDRKNESDVQFKGSSYLRPVDELILWARKNLQDYVLIFWIHGSIASDDYVVGWSDLDTYIVVKESTILDSSKLCKLRELLLIGYNYLLEVDPLQHHGFLTCSEFDLDNYLPGYLPIDVLRNSIQVFGPDTVDFNVCSVTKNTKILPSIKELLEKSVKTGIFKHHPLAGIYLHENYQNDQNSMYQMKNFISLVNILPIYYYNDKGVECEKKDSFSMIYDEHIHNLDLLRLTSDIRLRWEKEEEHPYKGNHVPHWLKEMLGMDYFSRTLKLVNELIRNT